MRGRFVFLVLLGMLAAIFGECATALASEPGPYPLFMEASAVQANPGTWATIALTLQNNGKSEITLALSAEAPAGWQLLPLAPDSMTLAPEVRETAFVTVGVPFGARAGEYAVAIRAMVSPGGEVRLAAPLVVASVRQIELSKTEGPGAFPGEPARHQVFIHNKGNSTEEIALAVRADPGWTAALDSERVRLEPGEKAALELAVSIPERARPGVHQSVRVVASMTGGQGLPELAVGTEVLPPTAAGVPPLRPDVLRGELLISKSDLTNLGGVYRITAGAKGVVGDGHRIDVSTRAQAGGGEYELDNVSLRYSRGPWSASAFLDPDVQPWTQNRFQIGYRTPRVSVVAGDHALSLSSFLRASGRGGAVEYRRDGWGLSLGLAGDAWGARVGRSARTGELGVAFLSRGGGTSRAWSLEGRTAITSSLYLTGAVARSEAGTGWSLGAGWDRGRTAVSGRYYWYGPGFNLGGGDGNGYELRLSTYIRSAPLQFVAQDRVVGEGDVEARTDRVRSLSLQTGASWASTSAALSLNYERAETLDDWAINPRDTEQWSGGASIRWILGERSSLSLAGDLKATRDLLVPRSSASFALAPRYGTGRGPWSVSVGYGLVGSGSWIDEAWEERSLGVVAAASYDPAGDWWDRIEARYQGGTNPVFELSSRVRIEGRYGSLTLRASAELRGDKFNWKVQGAFVLPFDLPVPGVYSSGKIKGRVVIVNGDGDDGGDRDEGAGGEGGNGPDAGGDGDVGAGGEDGAGGALDRLVVRAGRSRVSTSADGSFEFPPLAPGRYEVAIENLPVGYGLLSPAPVEVTVTAGKVATVEIPLARLGTISGQVIHVDEAGPNGLNGNGYANGHGNGYVNRNGVNGNGAALNGGGYANVVLRLTGDGGFEAVTFTNRDGLFQFSNVPAGTYRLWLDEGSLPARTRLLTENPAVVTLAPSGYERFTFKVAARPLDVIIQYQGE